MIYILEDDNSIRELVTYSLNSAGFECIGFDRPSRFWTAVGDVLPSLVMLDIMLPEEDGLQVLKKLRSGSATRKIPVIMLTAKSSEYDKVIGLDSGADDYIPKPFGMMELIARTKAMLRRSMFELSGDDEYHIGELYVSLSKHVVNCGSNDVALTLKEFELLCFLLKNRGIVLTRDKLLDSIWGYSFDGESRTVDVHIRSLRQKLGRCGDVIETVRGIGYKISDK